MIDHAWGYEPVTIADIKAYKPSTKSISSGQVLQCAYDFEKARVVVQEMADFLALDLVEKRFLTDQIVLTVGYDIENLKEGATKRAYTGEVTTDRYGRKVPKHAHGTANLSFATSSSKLITDAATGLYDKLVNRNFLIRRIHLEACRLQSEEEAAGKEVYEQLTLFAEEEEKAADSTELKKERRIQEALLAVKKRYGKNAILKGMNFKEGATGRDRNNQIGGHKA